MTGLAPGLVRVVGILLASSAAGWLALAAAFPGGRAFRFERLGWSFAVGCGLVAASVPLALAAGGRPGWPWVLALGLATALAGRALRLRKAGTVAPTGPRLLSRRRAAVSGLLGALAAAGVALYALRALTEPMWSNDFLAIWGLKGKAIFGAGTLPEPFVRSPHLGFSHPEYPVGLPLLYAGISFWNGRWDDHAMAAVFPLTQVATLLALAGWLRRRGASPALGLSAAAVVACYEPLYSGFLTGMAEVPLAFALLLFGSSLTDALDETDAGAARRLGLASAAAAALKNEGLYVAVAGAAVALASGGRGRRSSAAWALVPALAVRALHVPWRSRLPLADFDVSTFSLARTWDSIAAAFRLPGAETWAAIALAGVLLVLGSCSGAASRAGHRMLVLCVAALAAYLVLPAFAVRGPEWLVATTLRRTVSALVPLAAAAIAVRFSGGSAEFSASPTA